MIRVDKMVLGPLGTNTYLLEDAQTGRRAVVDPASADERLLEEIRLHAEFYDLILLTHRHFDHLMGAYAIKQITGAHVCVHEQDACGCENASDSLFDQFYFGQPFIGVTVDRKLQDADQIELGDSLLQVLHTPGHSAGGVCYLSKSDRFLLSGDTLMKTYFGRIDFPTGNIKELLASVQKLFSLSDDWRVLPGHGDETTIQRERTKNEIVRWI